jgi:hypothetical protein
MIRALPVMTAADTEANGNPRAVSSASIGGKRMNRAPLVEEDQAFLQRLDDPRRHSTFAGYIYDEIRGHKWRPEQYAGLKSTNPAYIAQEVTARLRWAIAKWQPGWPTHHTQWLEAVEAYPDEFLRYIRWCLAWEQRSKREKQGYRWNAYQKFRSWAPEAT